MKEKRIIFFSIIIVATLLIIVNSRYNILAFRSIFNADSCDLKVLSWNTHCSSGADSARQIGIAQLIIDSGADIVFLTEFLKDNCTIIDSLLSASYLFCGYSDCHDHSGNAFYSKRPIIFHGSIETHVYNRPVGMIAATLPILKDSIFVIGLHLPSNSEEMIIEGDVNKSIFERYTFQNENRSWCMHYIKKWVSEQDKASIVMGDFNDFSFSAPCDSLKIIGMKDAWWEGGLGYGTTFHDGWMRLRIDHIFHSPELKLCGVVIIDTDLSDHNPVVARFKME